jgi:hypothetical protein
MWRVLARVVVVVERDIGLCCVVGWLISKV